MFKLNQRVIDRIYGPATVISPPSQLPGSPGYWYFIMPDDPEKDQGIETLPVFESRLTDEILHGMLVAEREENMTLQDGSGRIDPEVEDVYYTWLYQVQFEGFVGYAMRQDSYRELDKDDSSDV